MHGWMISYLIGTELLHVSVTTVFLMNVWHWAIVGIIERTAIAI